MYGTRFGVFSLYQTVSHYNGQTEMTKINSICVYCGSQSGTDLQFANAAIELGRIMALHKIRLVYGAGTRGLMGEIAKSVHENGGEVTGIIPEFLLQTEAAHKPELYCDKVIVTANMHERKQKMFELSDAFIAMPGGIGTLEELVEIMTWAQLARHEKPISLLNINEFWDPLINLLDHMGECGFLHSAARIRPVIMTRPAELETLLG